MQQYIKEFTVKGVQRAIKEEWGLSIHESDIRLAEKQGKVCLTAFVRSGAVGMVVKCLKPNDGPDKVGMSDDNWEEFFHREPRILADIAAANDKRLRAPNPLYVGQKTRIFAMEKFKGKTLRDVLKSDPDFLRKPEGAKILNQLADAMIAFHEIMKDKSTIPTCLWTPPYWINDLPENLPSVAQPLLERLRSAKSEIGQSPYGLRYQHFDPNPDNIIIFSDGTIGMIDFGYAQHGDPEMPLSLMAVDSAYGLDVAMGMAERLNKYNPSDPWVDINRIQNLAAVHATFMITHNPHQGEDSKRELVRRALQPSKLDQS